MVDRQNDAHSDSTVHGVVLSGGLVYGAYEVGVMKALCNGLSPATFGESLQFQVFAGTSAGAFNAAQMVAQADADDCRNIEILERLWIDRLAESPSRCGGGVYRIRGDAVNPLHPDCFARQPMKPLTNLIGDSWFLLQDSFKRVSQFVTSQDPIARRAVELVNLGSLFDLSPLERLVHETLRPDLIRHAQRRMRITATNWRTGEPRIFTNHDMTDQAAYRVVLASTAFSGVQPVILDGHPYGDGGYAMATPLSPAIRAGANILHVISLAPPLQNLPTPTSTIETLEHVYQFFVNASVNREIEHARFVNRGIELLGQSDKGRKVMRQMRNLVVDDEPIDYRQLIIHRYHPTELMTSNVGLLNFSQPHIEFLIQQGFQDAVEHDCVAAGCVNLSSPTND